jgi:hypothetical protein
MSDERRDLDADFADEEDRVSKQSHVAFAKSLLRSGS